MKVAYVIMRGQPFHVGHKSLIDRGLEIADRVVLIFGDTGCARSFKNPWTVEERSEMVRATYASEPQNDRRIVISSVEDVLYEAGADQLWKFAIKSEIDKINSADRVTREFLVGHRKDNSSYYLDLFPEWEPVFTSLVGGATLNATNIRDVFFSPMGIVYSVPQPVHEWLQSWRIANKNCRYVKMALERDAISHNRNTWSCIGTRAYGGPVLAAADAMLYDANRILLIRRGGNTGYDTYALPGGYVNPSEDLVEAALRELAEEASVSIPRSELPDWSPRLVTPFGNPGRSQRGRIVSNVTRIYMPHLSPACQKALSEVVPAAFDDAKWAGWVSLKDLSALKSQFFSDHYHIIQALLKEAP
jgi:bifunctional NMN adenylyltransferase/nudix hydrolase